MNWCNFFIIDKFLHEFYKLNNILAYCFILITHKVQRLLTKILS